MRTLTTAQSAVLALQHRAHHVKVEIDRDGSGTWIDMTSLHGFNWVESVEWTEDIDQATASATISLRHRIQGLSLNPLMTATPPNLAANGTTQVLCQPYRKIRIYTATIAQFIAPVSGDWNLIFRGRIWRVDWQGPSVQLDCRDEGGDLLDNFVETIKFYGTDAGVAVETASQSILTDNSTGVTLYLASASPGWNLKKAENAVSNISVLDILRRYWVDSLGWDLRFKWRAASSDFKLVATNPTRTGMAVDATFTADQYTVEGCSLSNDNIRNAIQVTYYNKADKATATTTVTDTNSIAKYGRKFMRIAEEETSEIDSATEADALAAALLKDLKEPTMNLTISTLYFWPAELNDYYTIYTNGVHFEANQSLALKAVTHSFAPDGAAKSKLTLTGAPKSSLRRILVQVAPFLSPAPKLSVVSQTGKSVMNPLLTRWRG